MLTIADMVAAGSFGAMDPASHDLYMFLEKLQQQQKEVVNLIKERQRIIAERYGTPLPQSHTFVPRGSSPPPLPTPPMKEQVASPAGGPAWPFCHAKSCFINL